jgi:hypothetical protein
MTGVAQQEWRYSKWRRRQQHDYCVFEMERRQHDRCVNVLILKKVWHHSFRCNISDMAWTAEMDQKLMKYPKFFHLDFVATAFSVVESDANVRK